MAKRVSLGPGGHMTRSGDWRAVNTNHQCPKGQLRGRISALEEAYGEIPVETTDVGFLTVRW